jgi:thiamine pyrophosphate-dependent acetolactate synthase large subunit-like protein
MGPALGQAIAAQLVYPDMKIICLLGDSSFGFSGMEIETMCRYRLPIIMVIINNSGIAMGLPIDTTSKSIEERIAGVPPTSLLGAEQARYEMLATAFGGNGFFVTEPSQINAALSASVKSEMPSIINICISPMSNRRAQSHDWLSRSVDSKL